MVDPVFGSGLAVAAISFVLAVSVAFAMQLLPAALQDGWLSLPHSPLMALCIAAFLAAGAYAASFVGQAMTDLVDSGMHEWRFDLEVERAARFAASGIAGLLGGPILFLAGGLWYWVNCGEMTALDWLILAELSLAGIGSWLTLCSVSAVIGEFALTCPAKFPAVIRRLGCRGMGVIGFATLLIALHVAVAVLLCEQFQDGGEGAVFWLGTCAFSGIVVTTLLLSQLSRMSRR